jgi:hypothetical protein
LNFNFMGGFSIISTEIISSPLTPLSNPIVKNS